MFNNKQAEKKLELLKNVADEKCRVYRSTYGGNANRDKFLFSAEECKKASEAYVKEVDNYFNSSGMNSK